MEEWSGGNDLLPDLFKSLTLTDGDIDNSWQNDLSNRVWDVRVLYASVTESSELIKKSSLTLHKSCHHPKKISPEVSQSKNQQANSTVVSHKKATVRLKDGLVDPSDKNGCAQESEQRLLASNGCVSASLITVRLEYLTVCDLRFYEVDPATESGWTHERELREKLEAAAAQQAALYSNRRSSHRKTPSTSSKKKRRPPSSTSSDPNYKSRFKRKKPNTSSPKHKRNNSPESIGNSQPKKIKRLTRGEDHLPFLGAKTFLSGLLIKSKCGDKEFIGLEDEESVPCDDDKEMFFPFGFKPPKDVDFMHRLCTFGYSTLTTELLDSDAKYLLELLESAGIDPQVLIEGYESDDDTTAPDTPPVDPETLNEALQLKNHLRQF